MTEPIDAAASPVEPPTTPKPEGAPSAAVYTKGLSKMYGDKPALDSLDLEIECGKIFGYIGPNGAGKTTTIRILAGLLKPSKGRAEILGVDVEKNPQRVKEFVGYMPDSFGVYDNMTLDEYLEFFAAAYRLARKRRRAMIEDVLALTDLGSKRRDLVSGFSKGMKQRACLAKTLLHDPAVLILDEPASGLDPRARIEFRELLRELKTMGKTILVSSHILVELSAICDSVGILEQGQLVAAGNVDEILRSLRRHREFSLKLLERDDEKRAIELLEPLAGVSAVRSDGAVLRIEITASDAEISAIPSALVGAGIAFIEFAEDVVDLEAAFMKLTEGKIA